MISFELAYHKAYRVGQSVAEPNYNVAYELKELLRTVHDAWTISPFDRGRVRMALTVLLEFLSLPRGRTNPNLYAAGYFVEEA